MDPGHSGQYPGQIRGATVGMRSKRWWNDEIAELRKELGKARRADRYQRTGAARRDLRRAIRTAKKAFWNNFLENASSEDAWTAARYTNPRPDDSARPLISGERIAVTHEEKEQLILEAAFPEPRPDNGVSAPPRRDGIQGHRPTTGRSHPLSLL